MVMFRPYLPTVLALIIFVLWAIRKKEIGIIELLGRGLFVLSCILLFDYFFIPLPLNAVGFYAISDELLPIYDAINFIPFLSLVDNWKHLDYYFDSIIPMLVAAMLLGFSVNICSGRRLTLKINFLIAFLVPFVVFVLYAMIRILSGVTLKKADISNVIWFAIAYFIGYVVQKTAHHFLKGCNCEKD
ncbi:MAG: hypothetical protein IKH21_07745 [Clostridia bacterium]|nr:hypothetical protein [Clostridia bacterium]MBR5719285.1 hypothetical protein [Clostridia bacterium]